MLSISRLRICRVLRLAAMILLLAAPSVSAQPAAPPPRVRETAPRGRAADDPAINPQSTRPHPVLPPRALVDTGPVEEEERHEGWAVAKWTTHILRLPSNVRRSIAVTAPSVLLIRASWRDAADLTIRVTQGSTTLKTFTGLSGTAAGRLATAQVNVPAAGQVTIAVSGQGATAVTLHVGVLPTR
jgi:hypothetical protein